MRPCATEFRSTCTSSPSSKTLLVPLIDQRGQFCRWVRTGNFCLFIQLKALCSQGKTMMPKSEDTACVTGCTSCPSAADATINSRFFCTRSAKMAVPLRLSEMVFMAPHDTRVRGVGPARKPVVGEIMDGPASLQPIVRPRLRSRHYALQDRAAAGTTSPNQPSRRRWGAPSTAPGSRSRPGATPFAIPSPRTCSKTDTTSAPCRSCSATPTCNHHDLHPRAEPRGPTACAVRSTTAGCAKPAQGRASCSTARHAILTHRESRRHGAGIRFGTGLWTLREGSP
jgi:hypothetical protein